MPPHSSLHCTAKVRVMHKSELLWQKRIPSKSVASNADLSFQTSSRHFAALHGSKVKGESYASFECSLLHISKFLLLLVSLSDKCYDRWVESQRSEVFSIHILLSLSKYASSSFADVIVRQALLLEMSDGC